MAAAGNGSLRGQATQRFLGTSEGKIVKNYRIYLISFVGLLALFSVVIYPRPFKQTDLSDLSIPLSRVSEPEFSYVGFWHGCQIEVYPLEGDTVPPLGSLPSNLESKFSPWISSLEGVLHQEAYFYTLDFDECYVAFNEKYPGEDMKDQLFGSATETELRVGGITEFLEPLSHANSLIILTIINQREKLILLRGGY